MAPPPFSTPPLDLELIPEEIHVWRASLDEPTVRLQILLQTLSLDKRIRADRFHFEKYRKALKRISEEEISEEIFREVCTSLNINSEDILDAIESMVT